MSFNQIYDNNNYSVVAPWKNCNFNNITTHGFVETSGAGTASISFEELPITFNWGDNVFTDIMCRFSKHGDIVSITIPATQFKSTTVAGSNDLVTDVTGSQSIPIKYIPNTNNVTTAVYVKGVREVANDTDYANANNTDDLEVTIKSQSGYTQLVFSANTIGDHPVGASAGLKKAVNISYFA